ncbi:phosphatase PAP2 family protein [Natranaeroarchaeum sulfidigenes]|uniref:Membrane-associated phospholipid phosphatase n=1 Tax=Natranaeroarchaeum sulfidigenes TaxID=2784880 RepID=A0A897ML29_9EURY|nr:phosphatase PAP2 family protein [Natranaeroarchaeum sulfidigenes]QSG01264.1 Membrane-associated phospholipid phosphatase [Natranaeroarchaeum sulfidigenes]
MFPIEVLVLFLSVIVVTAVGLSLVCWWCLSARRLHEIRHRPDWVRDRLRAVGPFVLLLALVLLVNKGSQSYIERFSHAYGFEATATIYAIEGDFVVTFQSLVPDITMPYFSAVYVVGYALLLIAPVFLYFFADRARPLKLLVTAYAINYAVAVVFYASVVAYGPRNADRSSDGSSADAPLLELVPDITHLTALWNTNTNVFPSLHTSLSVTVFLLAAMTREEFRRWFGLSSVLAASIVVATMALGIHWLVDVLAGIVLAVVAVTGARAVVTRPKSH